MVRNVHIHPLGPTCDFVHDSLINKIFMREREREGGREGGRGGRGRGGGRKEMYVPSPKAIKLQGCNLSLRRHILVCSHFEHMKLVLCSVCHTVFPYLTILPIRTFYPFL